MLPGGNGLSEGYILGCNAFRRIDSNVVLGETDAVYVGRMRFARYRFFFASTSSTACMACYDQAGSMHETKLKSDARGRERVLHGYFPWILGRCALRLQYTSLTVAVMN